MSPRQQLLQAPQLPLLLLTVLLLLLPLLLQRRDLGFIAADGVWQGRRSREIDRLVMHIMTLRCLWEFHAEMIARAPGV